MARFALNKRSDTGSLRQLFERSGRVQVRDLLEEGGAAALHDYMATTGEWHLTANRGDQVVTIGPEALAAMTGEQHQKLGQAVTLGGRYGFQYCYDTIRLPDDAAERAALATPLAEFERFLCSPEVIAYLREVTGIQDFDFADAHASRYRTNQFLNAHDDASDGMGRRAAYVMNLSPQWRTDWGGLLLFHDGEGNVEQGFRPAFNTLNLFAVPQPHSVSWVTPLAPHPRLAVTGWLRSSATRT